MSRSPFRLKQQLSKAAALKKASRDLIMAKSPARKKKKAQNQKKDRKDGTVGDGMDQHHTKSGLLKRVSIKNNRGYFGRGTQNE